MQDVRELNRVSIARRQPYTIILLFPLGGRYIGGTPINAVVKFESCRIQIKCGENVTGLLIRGCVCANM